MYNIVLPFQLIVITCIDNLNHSWLKSHFGFHQNTGVYAVRSIEMFGNATSDGGNGINIPL
jgi:hypothetical protein